MNTPDRLSRRTWCGAAGLLAASALTAGLRPARAGDDAASPASPPPDTPADEGPELRPGATFNESQVESDVATSRPKRRLTTRGKWNNTPYFHYGTLFTDDSRFVLVNTTRRQGRALMKADLHTGELTVLAATSASCTAAIVPKRNAVAIIDCDRAQPALRRIDLASFESKLLRRIAADKQAGPPVVSCDGRRAYWPEWPRLDDPTPSVADQFAAYVKRYGGIPTTIYEMDLDTQAVRQVYEDPKCRTYHMHACPTDAELLLIERDQPPWFSWRGDAGKTTRDWVLNVRTGKLVEIRPRNAFRFQMHTSWSHDGQYVLYHSRDAKDAAAFFGRNGGGHYLGAADLKGRVKWERVFPYLYYGHVAGHTRRNSIVFDSLTTPDLICEIDFERLSGDEAPEIKILARHGSILTTGSADSHPHMQLSPDGRWLVYNWGDRTRSEVHVVEMGS